MRSHCYNVGLAAKEEMTEASKVDPGMTPRRISVPIEFIAGIVSAIYDALNGWDSGPKPDGVFLVTVAVCGLIGGFNGN